MKVYLHSMVKAEYKIRHLLISQELFYWTQVISKSFGSLPISEPYGSPTKLIIYFAVILLTSSGMDQDLNINTSTYGVWKSTSSIDMLQEGRLMKDHIAVISWDIRIPQD